MFFGRADENPAIHWNTFDQADIAFGELNAASLGVIPQAEFRQETLDPVVLSKTGSIEALARPSLLKFRIILPQFDEHTSGYQWILMLHRHKDGRAPNYKTGEIVSCGESYPLAHSNTALTKSRIASAAAPRSADYKPEKNMLTQIKGSGVKDGRVKNNYIEFNGSIELTKSFNKHNIEAATLSVAYWPDRTFPDGYAEIILKVSNKP